jgi:hypothetical protein
MLNDTENVGKNTVADRGPDQRGATEQLLKFLLDNGTQSVRELEQQPFWGGVRSRVPKLMEQGRLIRVDLPNPHSGGHGQRIVVPAYKVPDDVFTGKLHGAGGRQKGAPAPEPDPAMRDRAQAAKRDAMERLALLTDDEWHAVKYLIYARDRGHLADDTYGVGTRSVGALERNIEVFDRAIARLKADN